MGFPNTSSILENYDLAEQFDPRVVPTDAPKGAIFRYVPSSGPAILLQKQDKGESTNWTVVGSPKFEAAHSVYVSLDGSDVNGDGTPGSPWRSVSYAQSQIEGLVSASHRFMICLAPGIYHEAALFYLIPNIGIQSEGWNDSTYLYFDAGMVLHPTMWNSPDPRSAFVNMNIQNGPTVPGDFASNLECVLDFKGLGSLEGKIFFYQTAIRNPLTVYGDTTENHAVFDAVFFYRDLKLWDLSVLITNSNDIFAENPYKFFVSSTGKPFLFSTLNVVCIASWFKHVIVQPPHTGVYPFDDPDFGQTGGLFAVLDLEVHDLELYGPNTYVQATSSSIPTNIPSPDSAQLNLFQLNPKFIMDFPGGSNSFFERLNDGFAIAYAPATAGNWQNPQPTNVRDALDQLAARVKALEP